ncbi:MAG: AtpZ/AtpI family protein [Bacillota bacterium]
MYTSKLKPSVRSRGGSFGYFLATPADAPDNKVIGALATISLYLLATSTEVLGNEALAALATISVFLLAASVDVAGNKVIVALATISLYLLATFTEVAGNKVLVALATIHLFLLAASVDVAGNKVIVALATISLYLTPLLATINRVSVMWRQILYALGLVVQIGLTIAVSAILGWWGGAWLDVRLTGGHLLSIIGLVLGLISGFAVVFRLLLKGISNGGGLGDG